MANVALLKERYNNAGQGHVFNFYDSLSEAEQQAFVAQLEKIDPSYVNKIVDLALHPPQIDGQPAVVEPLPESAQASILDSKPEDIERWYKKGLELIAQNKVAVVLMAGGQGTRLGSAAPKGCYNIGLPSKKSLFQIQAERIQKVQELAGKTAGKSDVVVPWYVMTSGPTRGNTEKFFKREAFPELDGETEEDRQGRKPYFGLDQKNVIVFEQGVLPCISNDKKIMLQGKGQVAVAPDGNGGLYRALYQGEIETESGAKTVLDDMRARGIEHIHAYCVDNCLVKVADPVFIGFSAEKNVDLATKVVRKRDAAESVGLILQKNGKPDVVEYSEIDDATRTAVDPKQPDVLKFRAANIVNHYYSFSYLDSISSWMDKLPHHVANKKIPCIDVTSGENVKPSEPNGIKLEQFVFDNFSMIPLEKFACMEVDRLDEFSPLKNGLDKKTDNANTSKQDIMNQGKKWLVAAGAAVSGGAEAGVEVSPSTSYGGEGLEAWKGQTLDKDSI